METTLGLLVLRTDRREAVLEFYRTLGLRFVEEQHGSGPVHHAASMGTLVLEIYPGTAQPPGDPRGSGSTQLGFQVASLDMVLKALEACGILPKTPPKRSAWGRRAVVLDPDGRAVELLEPVAPQDAELFEGEKAL